MMRLFGESTAIPTTHTFQNFVNVYRSEKVSDHRPYHDNFFTPTQLIHFRRQYRQYV